MYFKDLDICTYHTGPFDAKNWAAPLLAVGWLEHPHEFTAGDSPNGLLLRLNQLVEQTRSTYSHYTFRGGADCSYCLAAHLKSPGPIWSQENIFVPGSDAIYVAPGGIVHYVETHSYLPPTDFIDSVLRCPDFHSKEYAEALRISNNGVDSPLKSTEQFDAWVRSFQRK